MKHFCNLEHLILQNKCWFSTVKQIHNSVVKSRKNVMDGEDKRMTAEEAQGENVSALSTAHPRRSRKPQTFMCMCQP